MGIASSRVAAAPGAPSPPHRPSFDTLVKEELAMHAAATPDAEIPSCLTLFDKWLSCYALGPQFQNVYRYGTVTDCAAKREDFKFCLTLRELDPDARRRAWLARKAERTAHQRQGYRSSEAVWEIRRDPLLDADFVDPSFPPP
ncbi:hypothetical protein MSPP1_000556 [Malassezia sp. CBS 17886]|nr:hypothetical protein MSPP1_000556 [Malassezia sp. CBS 17886]